ncbi:MAG TPA: hypothetical protein VEK57_13970 [Thermoanaerobaculia bacterium]|nr:hypothetical protein [Thermoanaerobaculia bacterium]
MSGWPLEEYDRAIVESANFRKMRSNASLEHGVSVTPSYFWERNGVTLIRLDMLSSPPPL